jgi:alpha-N-arabinofuranosidase
MHKTSWHWAVMMFIALQRRNNMITTFKTAIGIFLTAFSIQAAVYHVSLNGLDSYKGSKSKPFKTISAAARIAQPGDMITVHEGIYRERVNPPRGGTSAEQRIVYQTAPGEKVVITGSEPVTGWKKVENDTWKVTLPNSFFGEFNPYSDVLEGHWFRPRERVHHTGSVYLNGVWRGEAASLEDVLKPAADDPLWFGEVADEITTIWAQFPGVDPNAETVEINARQTVFFPEQTGLNYITVRGFILRHAATPWSAPPQQQMGLIGPHWSKGWIIEDNEISHSITVGVQLGTTYQGKYLGNVAGFRDILKDASESGAWSRENVGSHIVRRNRISHCEAGGITGSMGGAFSLLENNFISDIHVRRTFGGLEQGGIKLHGAIDTVIRGNTVCRTGGECRAIWVDWLAQGAVIEGNIGFDNQNTDLYVEVTHGPTLVANNIFLSRRSVVSTSRGTAFVNNYFAGIALIAKTTRQTPYAEPHSTRLVDIHINNPGDDRYINNIFAGAGPTFTPGWGGVDQEELNTVPYDMEGNLYLNGAVPPIFDQNHAVLADVKPPFRLVNAEGLVTWSVDSAWRDAQVRPVVTSARLGKTAVAGLPYEMPDGSPVKVDHDFSGAIRNAENTMPGPIETAGTGRAQWKTNYRETK